jgi:deoxyribonuclease (pyrimidine dimer)
MHDLRYLFWIFKDFPRCTNINIFQTAIYTWDHEIHRIYISKKYTNPVVRVNLINPKKLADQHLVAEYDEILMLTAYIKKYPKVDNIPKRYCLGKGHMTFFKDKILYLKKRHETLKSEMRQRGFKTNKTIDIDLFSEDNKKDWKPGKLDFELISERITSKIRLKPEYYRYYGEYKPVSFFIDLLK